MQGQREESTERKWVGGRSRGRRTEWVRGGQERKMRDKEEER